MELLNKIKKVEEKMKGIDKSSMMYQNYASTLTELKRMVPRGPIVLHKDDGAGVCESCQ